MAVKFKQPHTVGALYNKDEIAKFDPEVEADLIKRKIAEAVEDKVKGKGRGKPAPPKPTLTVGTGEGDTFVVLDGDKVVKDGFADEAAAQAYIAEQA